MRALLTISLLSLLLPLWGCGSDTGSNVGPDPDSGSPVPADGSVADVGVVDSVAPDQGPTADGAVADGAVADGVTPVSCDQFPDLAEVTTIASRYKFKVDEERGGVSRVMYVGEAAGGLFLRATVWQGIDGSPTGPGAIDLATVPKTATAGAVVRFGHGCDPKGRECTTEFVGFKGTLKLSSLDWASSVGSTFAGSLEQIEFRQVTIVAEVPIEVPDGCSFTLTAHAFSGAVTLSSGSGD